MRDRNCNGFVCPQNAQLLRKETSLPGASWDTNMTHTPTLGRVLSLESTLCTILLPGEAMCSPRELRTAPAWCHSHTGAWTTWRRPETTQAASPRRMKEPRDGTRSEEQLRRWEGTSSHIVLPKDHPGHPKFQANVQACALMVIIDLGVKIAFKMKTCGWVNI